ncbi:MAG: HAD-IB family hydrolase [Acidimicrobiales bacterium]
MNGTTRPPDAELRPTVAAFDFDGTITRGGSTLPFLIFVRGLLPVLGALVSTLPQLLRAAAFSGAAADTYKEDLFVRLLGGMTGAELGAKGRAFASHHLRKRLRPEVRRRMEWHRDEGHQVVVVSASAEHYVVPAAEMLGAHGALATRLAVDAAGIVSGRFEGKNCRGAEKYARVVGWLRSNGLAGAGRPQAVLWAYGNSRGDAWLLGAADHPIDAGKLGALGALRRFPRLGASTDRDRAASASQLRP